MVLALATAAVNAVSDGVDDLQNFNRDTVFRKRDLGGDVWGTDGDSTSTATTLMGLGSAMM